MLERCSGLWGTATVIESDPTSEVVRNVCLVPIRRDVLIDEDRSWGVYDEAGRLVRPAGYFRLPAKYLVGQCEQQPEPLRGEEAPSGRYAYVGPLILHYGHFITAFLPRLWQLVRRGISPDTVFVCHSQHDVATWFASEPIHSILAALGLGPDRFWVPDRPIAFPRLTVDRPAMEEQTFIHRVLQDLGTQVGRGMTGSKRNRRIYLSKSRLTQGTFRLAEEQVMDNAMADSGLEVVYPETLPFSEQVRLMSESELVVGTAGSALHTSLFCGRPLRIRALAYGPILNANMVLIDRLMGSDAAYFYPQDGIQEEKTDAALFTYRLKDAQNIARELLQTS